MAAFTYNQYKLWLQKRRKTTIAYVIQSTLYGMEYSLTFLTLWLYIENLLVPDTPKVWYSLITLSFHVSSLISTLIISKYIDRTRNVKRMMILSNFIVSMGNLMYTMPYSLWFPLTGRIISGVAEAFKPVMSAEMVRSYDPESVSSILFLLGGGYCVGLTLGPCINVLFRSTNFSIYTWHISYENVTGIYMAIIYLIAGFLNMFLVFDLSKEFDFKACCYLVPDEGENGETKERKAFLQGLKPTEDRSMVDEQNNEQSSKFVSLRNGVKLVLFNFESALLLYMTFILEYTACSFDLWEPLLVIDVLHYGITELNIVVIVEGLLSVIFFVAFILKPLSNSWFFRVSFMIFASAAVLIGVVMILHHVPYLALLNIIMLTVSALITPLLAITTEVYLTQTLALMSDSSIQTVTESTRFTVCNLAVLTAFLSAPAVLDYIETFGFFLIAWFLIGLLLMYRKREFYANPSIILK